MSADMLRIVSRKNRQKPELSVNGVASISIEVHVLANSLTSVLWDVDVRPAFCGIIGAKFLS
jgi:hypothetical protein